MPRACPHCHEDLSDAAATQRVARIAENTRADAAAGDFDPIPATVFRRFRKLTKVWAGILGACMLLIVLGSGSTVGGPGTLALVLGWIGGIVAACCVLAFGISDLMLLPPENLTTPDKAFRTYLKCLKEKRWEYAWHLVVPRGRQGTRRRPAIDGLKVARADIDVDTPEGLGVYWKSILCSSGGTVRTTAIGKVTVATERAEDAAASCLITVTAHPTLVSLTFLLSPILYIIVYLIVRKVERLPLDLSLVRIDGRWYLLDVASKIPERTERS